SYAQDARVEGSGRASRRFPTRESYAQDARVEGSGRASRRFPTRESKVREFRLACSEVSTRAVTCGNVRLARSERTTRAFRAYDSPVLGVRLARSRPDFAPGSGKV